jgi:NAD(P)H dehydrogenase (quinone)
MTQPTVFVSGATGKVGGLVARQLLAAGWPVRALVRQQDSRSEALRALGASIAIADLTDADALRAAMQGTHRGFFLPPFGHSLIHAATAFADAAQSVRLESIVSLSQWLASPNHPSITTRMHWLSDRLMGRLPGIAHTIVNPGFFADNYLRTLPYAAHLGIFPWLYGEGRNAPPSSEDIASVATHALMKPELHAGRTYRPTGPELLSGTEMTQVISEVLGRRVIRMPMPFWMFLKAARIDGASIEEVEGYGHYAKDHAEGAFELGAPTSAVLDVTGRPPEDFATITRRYAAAAALKPTTGNRLRQLATFLWVPFNPGYNLKHYERTLRQLPPTRSAGAVGSEVWRREHLLPLQRSADTGPVSRLSDPVAVA